MPRSREAAPKHGLTLAFCAPIDTPESLDWYVIQMNDELLSGIGANVFAEGARFPGPENIVNPILFNDAVRQKLQWTGLQLMGAFVLHFDTVIEDSPDGKGHTKWIHDPSDAGHWTYVIQFPLTSLAGLASSGASVDGIEGRMPFRIKPDDKCIIQEWCEPDQMWVDWFNPRDCLGQTPDTSGSATRPAAQQTNCYHVVLKGNDIWQSPIGVKTDDVITISNMVGATYDGNLKWRCADGSIYAFGRCLGGGQFDATDPVPSEFHLALICRIAGNFYPLLPDPLTVAAGIEVSPLEIQVNDNALSDNSGQVEFDVCIQNGAAVISPSDVERCAYMDFTLAPYGWEPHSSGSAQWVSGQGWIPDVGGSVAIQFLNADAVNWTYVKVWYKYQGGTGGTDIGVGDNATALIEVTPLTSTADEQNAESTSSIPSAAIFRAGMTGGAGETQIAITKIQIQYTGPDQFADAIDCSSGR